jgi:hypothetical protein
MYKSYYSSGVANPFKQVSYIWNVKSLMIDIQENLGIIDISIRDLFDEQKKKYLQRITIFIVLS